jgi:hypothetical protein
MGRVVDFLEKPYKASDKDLAAKVCGLRHTAVVCDVFDSSLVKWAACDSHSGASVGECGCPANARHMLHVTPVSHPVALTQAEKEKAKKAKKKAKVCDVCVCV